MARDVRLLKPHMKNCAGLEEVANGWWESAWWVTGDVVYADSHGRFTKHAHDRWHVLQCNIQDCDGEAIVKESLITSAADKAFEEDR